MLHESQIAVLSLVVMMMCSAGVSAAEFELYVSPGGSDEAAGTRVAPFATIDRARRAARELKRGAGDTVVIRIAHGRYVVTEPIVLTPDDGAAEGERVIYRGDAGEGRAVISGGRAIAGWRVGDDGVWRTMLDAVKRGEWRFDELFVNGRRATRARYPNDGYLRVEQVGPDKRTSFTWRAGDLPISGDAGSAELVFLHDWSISRVRIKSIDAGPRTLTTVQTVGPHARHYAMDWFEKQPRYFIENHPALLDAPGEWHLDETSGELSYKPRAGETLQDASVVAPVATALLIVRGEERGPVRGVTFERIAFEHCAYDYGVRYAAGQAGFHEEDDHADQPHLRLPVPAAVTIEQATDIELRDVQVRNVGGSGVWVGSRCRDVTLSRLGVAHVGGNGVMIGEDRNRRIDGRAWADAAPEQATRNVTLTDSTIAHVGERFFGSVGVWIGMAADCRVEHNEIAHTPYTGVSVGWMWNPTPTPCRGHLIARNHIHHVMQKLSDGGGIYTLGRQPGTQLIGNVIHDVPVNVGRAESNGMFLDEGTMELVIEGNTIYNVPRSPLRFHKAEQNRVRRNTLVLGEGVPVVRYNNTVAEKITLEDNTIVPAKAWTAEQAQAALRGAGVRR